MAAEPQIAQLARRLMLDIEQAVRGFARFHKYQVGARLRDQTMNLAVLANRAWRDRRRQLEWTEELVWAIDEFKLTLQLGKEVKAFASFEQFAAIARITAELGKQVGGWYRQQKAKGPSAASAVPAPQCPQILSAHAASAEAQR